MKKQGNTMSPKVHNSSITESEGICSFLKKINRLDSVAQTCNPNYLGGRDQKD
jgi:hypothetical protein